MSVQDRTSSTSASSKTRPNTRTGGRILVDQLLLHGADLAFCVPGESYLEVLDALFDVRDRFKLVNARHEAGAANMAEAYGKLTGKPGICMVTRGPGACHASVGVHTAFQDSTPMIVLVGQIARGTRDREAFQEIDYRRMFGPVAKWAAEIETTSRIPEYMARAFQVATSGRPGPVVLGLPEDMLAEVSDAEDAKPYVTAQAAPNAAQLNEMRDLLASAERPLMIVGGGSWSERACREIVAFAESNGIPAACSFRRQDVFDNASENYIGDLSTSVAPSLAKRVKEADLLLVVGARLGEITTQTYRVISSPTPKPKLVHVYPDPDEIGRVYVPDLAIVSSSSASRLPRMRWRRSKAVNGRPGAKPRARTISTRSRFPRSISRSIWVRRSAILQKRCPGISSSPSTPEISPAGRIVLSAMRVRAGSSGRLPARWATACPRRLPLRSCIRNAPS